MTHVSDSGQGIDARVKPPKQASPEGAAESHQAAPPPAGHDAERTAPADSSAAPPSTPAESAPALNADQQRAAEQAMRRAIGATATPSRDAESSRAGVSASAAPAPAPIRGPRVIQGGREHRKGVVVSVGPEDVFIEFGPKELGVAQRGQWPEEAAPKAGDTIEVVIERFNPNEMLYICLRPGAVQRADWELLEKGQTVEAMVTGHNKGGLELEVAGHRAFMPASQIDIRRIDDFTPFVGQKLTCVVRKVDRAGRGNIVLSRRDHLATERKAQREELRESLKVGDTLEGEVVSVQPYGAFVDIGGVEGLVHVSDLSHERVVKPEQVVQPGETVKVQVLKLDWEGDRLSLGMKQVLPDPFEQAALAEGEQVTGRVTKITEFGAFVEVAPGVEGLVHISELSWQRVAKVDSVLKPGQTTPVKILSIDTDKRRVSLSVKQLTEPPKSDRRSRDDGRSAEEIRKETPAYRRMREEAKRKQKDKGGLKGGFGVDMGMGLGDLKL